MSFLSRIAIVLSIATIFSVSTIVAAQQTEERPRQRTPRVNVPPPPSAAIRDRRAPVEAKGVDPKGNPFSREDVLEKFRSRVPGSSPVEPVIIFNK